jgi:hypothetical protein
MRSQAPIRGIAHIKYAGGFSGRRIEEPENNAALGCLDEVALYRRFAIYAFAA